MTTQPDTPGRWPPATAGGRLLEVSADTAPLRTAPGPDAPLATELLRGERIRVAGAAPGEVGGWVAGRAELDGYAGHLPAGTLRPPGPPATHRVTARAALLYARPDAKAETVGIAWLGSLLALGDGRVDGFAATLDGSWVPLGPLLPLPEPAADPAAIAFRLLGAPYRYGGRSGAGLDCSALVQLALQAAGIPAPRDSGPQWRALGAAVAEADRRRGDLAFWDGHVGILLDADTLLHANAHHMAVAAEPWARARARLDRSRVAWRGLRRLPGAG